MSFLLACARSPREADTERGLYAALAQAQLQDTATHPLDVDALQHQTLVLNFVFTSCPTVCPLQTRQLAGIQAALSTKARQAVRFLSISIDPTRDTAETLEAFARANGADLTTWSFVRTTVEQTAALTSRLGVFDARAEAPAPGDHGTGIYLFDARGRLLQRYAGKDVDQPRLVRELTALSVPSGPPPG